VVGYLLITDQRDPFRSRDPVVYYAAMIVVSLLIVGPAEELLLRGVVQGGLRRSFDAAPAILIAALIFGALHGNVEGTAVEQVTYMGVTVVPVRSSASLAGSAKRSGGRPPRRRNQARGKSVRGARERASGIRPEQSWPVTKSGRSQGWRLEHAYTWVPLPGPRKATQVATTTSRQSKTGRMRDKGEEDARRTSRAAKLGRNRRSGPQRETVSRW